jgi:hypothetical protein
MTLAKRNLAATLSERQARFYRQALERFAAKMSWADFDDFAFGRESPLYEGVRLKQDVLDTPLYLELKDMWLKLGVEQGYVAAPEPKRAQRRS